MHEQLPEAGMFVDGKWELLRLLDEGGCGQVYEAWHAGLDRAFGIKFLNARRNDPVLRARFFEEARLMATMTSEHLVRVTDCDEIPKGLPYFVMELVQGETLRRRLRERMEMVRLLDFGLAKTSALAGGGVGGTPPYMTAELLLDGAAPRIAAPRIET